MVISPELCTSGRDLTEPRPSPDGALVAAVVRGVSGSSIVVVPVEGGPERLLTTGVAPAGGRGLGGGCFDWVPDGSAVVYVGVDGAVWSQPLGTDSPVRLTDHGDDRLARAPAVSDDGRWVAHVVDEAEVWVVAADGSGLGMRIDEGNADFCFDPWIDPTGDDPQIQTIRWQAWSVPHMPWDAAHVEIAHVDLTGLTDGGGAVVGRARRTGSGAIQQPRTLADGTPIEVRDDTGWNTVWCADEPLLADERIEHAGPSWGMGQRSYVSSPDGTRVAFTRNEHGFGRLCVLDRATGAVTEVGRGVHGQLGWVGRHLVALRTGARTPTQVVVYSPDATSGWSRRTLLIGPALGWGAIELPEPELLRVEHRGADRPPGADGDEVGVPARRFAAGQGRAIVWIHGGPTDQWQVTFMPRIAYWWSRGWDVIVPDPRGSTGHGRAHQQALHGGWGELDVDDTAAVVRHVHQRGWATPATTVLMGGSSGGLTVLGVLGRHPGLAAAGVTSYPVSDLADLADRSHRFEAHYTVSLVGPMDDVARYAELSPRTYAGNIDAPVLIMHGDADPVVPVEQSVDLAERIRAAGGDVELHVFPGEGHGFRRPDHRVTELDLTQRFLDRVLAGRAPQ